MFAHFRFSYRLGLATSAVLALALAGACSAVREPIPIVTTDAGLIEASRDDASIDAPSTLVHEAGTCEPGAVSTYQPTFHPVTGAFQDLCDDGDVQGYFEACLGSQASNDACSGFKSSHKDCAACIVTPDSASKYGPIVDHGTFVTANVGGCIALVAGTSPGNTVDAGSLLACARAVEAQAGCELAACEANCDVTDTASLNAYGTCATAADKGGCETYASAATCAESDGGDGGPEGQCIADFQDFYDDIVPLFCGPPRDAGPKYPPPLDASAE